MSCNEWENGTLKVPTAAWNTLKAAVRAAHDKQQAKRLATATHIHGLVLAAAKATRGKTHRELYAQQVDALVQRAHREQMRSFHSWNFSRPAEPTYALDYRDLDLIEDALFPPKPAVGGVRQPARTTMLAPKKKDFAPALTSVVTFSGAWFGIHFDNATKRVHWQVGENNRAVESAHEEPVALAFFAALKKVNWTRATGGVILYGSEYDSEAAREYEGGGGSRASFRFGPLGEDSLLIRQRTTRRRRVRTATAR